MLFGLKINYANLKKQWCKSRHFFNRELAELVDATTSGNYKWQLVSIVGNNYDIYGNPNILITDYE